MTVIGLAAVAVVALVLLLALVLVLRHLAALHLTSSQADVLRAEAKTLAASANTALAECAKDIEDTKLKLSALSNRVR